MVLSSPSDFFPRPIPSTVVCLVLVSLFLVSAFSRRPGRLRQDEIWWKFSRMRHREGIFCIYECCSSSLLPAWDTYEMEEETFAFNPSTHTVVIGKQYQELNLNCLYSIMEHIPESHLTQADNGGINACYYPSTTLQHLILNRNV